MTEYEFTKALDDAAWDWACNHPDEPDFIQDRKAAFLAGAKYIIDNIQKQ